MPGRENSTRPRSSQVATISRESLAGSIRDGLRGGGVIITAGPGYGKTTALAEALDGHARAAWIRVQDADRDAGHFLLTLLRALDRSLPGAVEPLKERSQGHGNARHWEATARSLVEALDLVLTEPFVIVVDDAEQLGSATESLAIVSTLVNTSSPNVRLAVAARHRLNLRIAKLRAAGRLLELGPADLLFSPEECAMLIATLRGRAPEPHEVETLMVTTEGWPMGVAFGVPHDRHGPGPGWFDATAAFNARFDELLERLEPSLNEEVLMASLAHTLSTAVRDALELRPGFAEEAARGGLVFSEVGDEGDLVCHPMLRTFLRARAREELAEGQWRDVHARLARACVADGLRTEAIEHWLQAHDWDSVLEAMAGEGVGLLDAVPRLAWDWLERIPSPARGSPKARLVEAQLDYGAGRSRESIELLRQAIEALRAGGEVRWEWAARRLLVRFLIDCGRLTELEDLARGFDHPSVLGAGSDAPGVAVLAAEGLASSARWDEARELFARARRHPAAAAVAPLIEAYLAAREFAAGDVDRALGRLRAAVAGSAGSEVRSVLWARAELARLLGDAGFHTEAADAHRELAQAEQSAGFGGDATAELAQAASADVLAGRIDRAEVQLLELGDRSDRGWSPEADIARALLTSAKDAGAAADPHLERAIASLPGLRANIRVGRALQLVPVLARRGAHAESLALLNEALVAWDEVASGERGIFYRARILLVRAWLCRIAGDPEAAMRDLMRAWSAGGHALPHLLRGEWSRARDPLSLAFARKLLDPEAAIDAVARGIEDPRATASFAQHESPSVRRAAIKPLLAAAHPQAVRALLRLSEDDDEDVATAAGVALERLRADPPPLAFSVLGGFGLRRGASRIEPAAWKRPGAIRVVSFLLCHRGEFVPEDILLDALWPETSPAKARRSLQVAISQVRLVLDVPRAPSSVVRIVERAYRLELGPNDSVDADEFEALATAALAERGVARRELLTRAADIWRGEPLPEESGASWASSWQRRLATRYEEILRALTAACLEIGDQVGAIDAATKLVARDPANEWAHRQLMLANARVGRRRQALRQYLMCRRVLVEELGIEPTTETTRLYARILSYGPSFP
jgi:DNA-binding SARP family transcriptional activator